MKLLKVGVGLEGIVRIERGLDLMIFIVEIYANKEYVFLCGWICFLKICFKLFFIWKNIKLNFLCICFDNFYTLILKIKISKKILF